MPQKLKGLVIDRVDLVDKGACHDRKTGDGAHILLYKRADAVASIIEPVALAMQAVAKSVEPIDAAKAETLRKDAQTFSEAMAANDARRTLEKFDQMWWAFYESARSILGDSDADKGALLRQSLMQYVTALVAAAPMMESAIEGAVEKVGRKIAGVRLTKLREMYDSLGKLLADCEEDETMAKTDAELQIEKRERDEAIAKAVEAALPAAVEKATAPLKEENAALKARVEKSEKAATDSETIAKAERDKRETSEVATTIEKSYRGLSLAHTNADDVAFMKRVKDAVIGTGEQGVKDFAKLDELLKSASALAAKGDALNETGTGQGGAVAGSADDEIEKKAAELVKSDAKTYPDIATAIAKMSDDRAYADLFARRESELLSKRAR